MLAWKQTSKPLLRAKPTRRALICGAIAALSGCGGGLHGMRRRVGFAVVNTRLLMHGRIATRTPAEFADVMVENPQIKTLVLQDMPDVRDAEAAMVLGRMVRARGLATALQSDSDISGGAVALFLAGQQRSMVDGARITVGNWDGITAAYVREMLGAPVFYQFALRVGAANPIHTITAQEISDYGLLTEPVKVWN
ncbi:hypothetical protein [uncultured Sulfitobacter sp.]|uniref:hypothetical protein n=1 Tax=uncultured Sulfitobacter sp. TaxID=191468 RepID=UPI00262731E0|nr:hypothetical protein [uncultured Sulfitobacter sp.]